MRKGIPSIVLLVVVLLVAACGGSEQPAKTAAGLSARAEEAGGSAKAQAGLPQGQPVQTAKGTYFNIDVNQVKPLLEDESVFTVNVHIPYAGDIPGTDASISFNEVVQQIDALPADKDAPVVVYCRSGSMSAQASETLVGLGYTKVLNLTGGMNAWQRAGNELVQR